MGVLGDLVTMLQTVAVCPSAEYCIAAGRLDCGACPARPPLENPPPEAAAWGDLTNSGLSHDGANPEAAERQGVEPGEVVREKVKTEG